ncbi:hypothetical protein MRX96_030325 [Rhipicephalus microplus]
MKSYVILALLILGHLCQIQAATLSKPAMSTDDAKKLLIEKLSRSIMEHREELIQALQGINSTGDVTGRADPCSPTCALNYGHCRRRCIRSC